MDNCCCIEPEVLKMLAICIPIGFVVGVSFIYFFVEGGKDWLK